MLLAATIPAACTTAPPAISQPSLTFGHLPPIRLGVDRIEILDATQPSMQAPNVEHRFPTPPAKAAERWARDRLHAAVGPATARIVIRNAKVTEEKLPKTSGLTGFFTVDQAARYDATLDVLIEIVDGKGKRLAFAETRVEQSQTVPEDVSVNEREAYWFRLVEALLRTFDAEMEANIRTHLAGYLR